MPKSRLDLNSRILNAYITIYHLPHIPLDMKSSSRALLFAFFVCGATIVSADPRRKGAVVGHAVGKSLKVASAFADASQYSERALYEELVTRGYDAQDSYILARDLASLLEELD